MMKEKRKKLKPGQLCTIVDKRTGDRYVIQAKRHLCICICVKCSWENAIFSMSCFMDRLEIPCYELFDVATYPKVIKHVKNNQFNQ